MSTKEVKQTEKVKIKQGKRTKSGATTRRFTMLGFLRDAREGGSRRCPLYFEPSISLISLPVVVGLGKLQGNSRTPCFSQEEWDFILSIMICWMQVVVFALKSNGVCVCVCRERERERERGRERELSPPAMLGPPTKLCSAHPISSLLFLSYQGRFSYHY